MDTLTLKRQHFFQNRNNRKVTHSFAPIGLIFNLQPEDIKFNDICLSWSSPKTDLATIFKFRKSKF